MLPCIEYFDDVKTCMYVQKYEKNEEKKVTISYLIVSTFISTKMKDNSP
jgi:hypothetical protein